MLINLFLFSINAFFFWGGGGWGGCQCVLKYQFQLDPATLVQITELDGSVNIKFCILLFK